jgi:3D (Asp-Asp-Asp) domain-containing protein
VAKGAKSEVSTVWSWLPLVTILALVGSVGVVSLLSGCSTVRPPRGVKPQAVTLTATGYCRCGKCCGWKRNWRFKPVYASGPLKGKGKRVGETASGSMARKGTIAADTSVYPFGTVMFIEGYGYGRVEDRGGAIKGARIDLFFNSHQQALEWGRQQQLVKVWRKIN